MRIVVGRLIVPNFFCHTAWWCRRRDTMILMASMPICTASSTAKYCHNNTLRSIAIRAPSTTSSMVLRGVKSCRGEGSGG